MNKKFALYLQKTKSVQITHKTPPVFNRSRLQNPHKTPPMFVRPGSLGLHKAPPPFTRPKNQENLIKHKTPPVFIRPASKLEDIDKKGSKHKKPPIFAKSNLSLKSLEIMQKFKNSGTWSVTDALSEDKDQSLVLESSNEFLPGFEFSRSKESLGLQSANSMNDSGRIKDEMKRFEPSASIESAIMNLQPEIREFDCFKQEDSHRDLCNYESSEYSSGSNRKSLLAPKTNLNIFSLFQAKPEILHKKPPAFNRKQKERDNLVYTIESNLSASDSLSPLSSVSNSSNIKIKQFEGPSDTQDHLFDSPNTPTSMISEISPEKSTLNLLKIKSNFLLENSFVDKTKSFSPFVSNNAYEKTFSIPMKPINYYDRSEENSSFKFDEYTKIPDVPNLSKIEFNYPSIKKGFRGSSTTVFIQTANLPDNIKFKVYLNPSIKQQEKISKYALKTRLSNKELDVMAKKLAKDLINRGIAYYLLVIHHYCTNQL